jgi:beta-lactamase class A
MAALIIVSCSATYFISEYFHHKISETIDGTISSIESNSGLGHYKFERLNGYKLIKPLVFAEPTEESSKYSDIKIKLTNFIEQLKSQQKLISASVYLRDFDQGEWMCINDTETYYPGSLIKVPGLITYLKMSEKNPDVLERNLVFNSPHKTIPNQTFNSKQIESGKPYSVRQLLKFMISYSDNNATYLLNKNVDLAAFHKLFEDLNIPKLSSSNSKITAKNFSVFFKVLFNASYLNRENSEFAVELLKECDFKLGMVKGLPVNTVVAHKFGEMGDETTRQLHESGLIYINNTPYLLTIMTKGYDVKDLPEIIGDMSKMVYQGFINKGTN